VVAANQPTPPKEYGVAARNLLKVRTGFCWPAEDAATGFARVLRTDNSPYLALFVVPHRKLRREDLAVSQGSCASPQIATSAKRGSHANASILHLCATTGPWTRAP